MKKSVVVLAAVAAVAVAARAEAQSLPTTPISVEIRAGAAIPQGDFKDVFSLVPGAELQTGYTLGGNVQFAVNPLLSIYAGYSYSSFGVEDEDVDVTDSGFNGGVLLNIPAATLPVQPFVRGGLVYNKVEFSEGNVSLDTDNQIGFEVGAGVGIPLGPRISFTPAVSYTNWSADEDDVGSDNSVASIKLDVGLKIRI